MAGPICTVSSSPLPTFSFLARSTRRSTNSRWTPFCTMIRLVAVQRRPVVPIAPLRVPTTARSRLASSSTIIGFLPPNSSEQCLKLWAAMLPTIRPTAEDPVRDTARTSGCSAIGVPTSAPNPVTMLITPLGSPASASARTRLKVDSGVSCAGLMTFFTRSSSRPLSYDASTSSGVTPSGSANSRRNDP